MPSRLWVVLAFAVAAASCAPAENSPLPPRPVATYVATETTVATTTTVAAATSTTEVVIDCPDVVCLIYHIDPDARWSDGAPVTASDFAFTADYMREAVGADPGMDAVVDVEVIDEKTALVALDRPLSSWPDLFGRLVRPDWSPGPPTVSTGPFVLSEWVPGDRVVLRRVLPAWSSTDPVGGQPVGSISSLRFVFEESGDTMVESLLAGDVDVVFTRPDSSTATILGGREDVSFEITPGPFWEHIAFNTSDPLLSQPWVRRAIATAIDREAILDQTIRLVASDAKALGNTIHPLNASAYQDNYSIRFDPLAAEQILIDNSCVRDEDQIYNCQGRKLSFLWAATDDDPARREAFEIVSDNLAAIGIELSASFQPPSRFVTPNFLFEERPWQIINFSWRATGDPMDTLATILCDGDLNVTGFCDPDLDALANRAVATLDLGRRDALFNDLDRAYLDSGAIIPLYQKPTLVAWSNAVEGPSANFSPSTDLWNVAAWLGPDQVTIAMLDEPASLDPVDFTDDAANTVLAALLYGAYATTPSLEQVPVLVESVEIMDSN